MLYLILGMLLSVIAVNGFLSESSIKKIQISSSLPRWTVAGSPLISFAEVFNRKRYFPSYLLRISHLWKGEGKKKLHEENIETQDGFCIKLNAGKRTKTRLVSKISRRGIYHLQGFRLATRFPFGLFDKSRVFESSGRVTVYPKPLPGEIQDFSLTHRLGEQFLESRGYGGDLYALRDYVSSDDARHIHWKVSAKVGKPITREYLATGGEKTFLYFDTRISQDDSFWRNRFELAVSHVAYLIQEAFEKNLGIGLWTPDIKLDPQDGENHFHRLMTYLASVKPTLPEGSDSAGGLPPEAEGDVLIIRVSSGSTPS